MSIYFDKLTSKSQSRTKENSGKLRMKSASHKMKKQSPVMAAALVCLGLLLIFILFSISKPTCEVKSADKNQENILNNYNIPMDDKALISIIREYLVPPSTLPYNFKNNNLQNQGIDPSSGQVQAIEDILRRFGGDGFYVECGANDGEWYSNSIWLERTLGWKGLLIEADPDTFKILSTKHRNAWTAPFCLSNQPFPRRLPFYQDNRENALGSGLIRLLYPTGTVDVQCFPLYSVLLAVNRTTVDFFSLDVEGSELDILRTVPWDKVLFKIITIENVTLLEGKEVLQKFMESKGYLFVGLVSQDSMFIHKSVELTQKENERIMTKTKPL